MTLVPAAPSVITTSMTIDGVSDAELDLIRGLLTVWTQKLPRNLLRSMYYDGTEPLKDLGISVPPSMKNLEVVLGWPTKAVKALAARNVWDGFVAPGADDDPFELGDLLEANRFDLELPQAIVSAYKHSCSFISTTAGDVQSGEPEVVILARSAEWSSALWDRTRRRVSAAMAITATDTQGTPTQFVAYLPDVVLTATRTAGKWAVTRQRNPLGQPLVEPLTYDPQLDRPFGRSRISRAVMNITDRAGRTVLRTEVGAEFYTAPQRYVLGADDAAFGGDTAKWKAAMGRYLALTKDEDGDTPTVGQFAQMSMEPHMAMLRQIATQFAGETGVPVNSLGVIQDNPSSAEAIYAAKEDLITEAAASNRVLGSSLTRVAQKAVQLRDRLTEPTPELRKIQARWGNPAFPSWAEASDALVKLSSVFPWIGESEVALEMAGFTDAQITRLMSDKRRAQAADLIKSLTAPQPAPVPQPTDPNAPPAPTDPAAPTPPAP